MPCNDEYDGQPKRLSQEEMERHIARVTAPILPVVVRDPFPVCPVPKVSKEQIDRMTDRLYTQSIEQRQTNMGMMEMRGSHPAAPPSRTMTSGEVAESATRLHDQTIEQRKRSLEVLRDKFEYKRKEPKPVSLKKFVEHMYDDRIEKKKQTEERLYAKYVTSTEIRTGRISRAQAKASGDRLSTK